MQKIILKKGELLGFETDTVWGLGCLPDDEAAVDKIYEIKGRNRSKPLILMSNSLENLLPYIKFMPDYAKSLVKSHFPGALTLIFEKSDKTPDFITSGKNTVGIRVPNHSQFQEICKNLENGVLATTSLNYSGENPVKSYEEAIEKFNTRIKIIKPENPIQSGISSTIILCTEDTPKVLRQGSVIITPQAD